MKVELVKYPKEEDWMFAKECALETVGKRVVTPPTMEWKHRSLRAMHSYIRELHFGFRFTDLPYWVSVHLVRHVHAQPYVRSQRNDRQSEYDRNKAPQDAPVTMMWTMNAEQLMNVAHKRLCMLASPETREAVDAALKLVEDKFPEFKGLFIPACEWHNGVCYEMFPCGKCKEVCVDA